MSPRATARHTALRLVFISIICCGLLLPANLSWLVSGLAQSVGPTTAARPRPGAPEGTWPNLEDVKNESTLVREAPAPLPSAVRSLQNSGKPWDGRRVGDAEPPRSLNQPNDADPLNRAHARRRLRTPPPPLDDQFVQNFFRTSTTLSEDSRRLMARVIPTRIVPTPKSRYPVSFRTRPIAPGTI
jgi:hypothetical protein